jgi:hypothetical protein
LNFKHRVLTVGSNLRDPTREHHEFQSIDPDAYTAAMLRCQTFEGRGRSTEHRTGFRRDHSRGELARIRSQDTRGRFRFDDYSPFAQSGGRYGLNGVRRLPNQAQRAPCPSGPHWRYDQQLAFEVVGARCLLCCSQSAQHGFDR